MLAQDGHKEEIYDDSNAEARQSLFSLIKEKIAAGVKIILTTKANGQETTRLIKGYDPVRNEWLLRDDGATSDRFVTVTAEQTRPTYLRPLRGG
jgi:hypothetical protein